MAAPGGAVVSVTPGDGRPDPGRLAGRRRDLSATRSRVLPARPRPWSRCARRCCRTSATRTTSVHAVLFPDGQRRRQRHQPHAQRHHPPRRRRQHRAEPGPAGRPDGRGRHDRRRARRLHGQRDRRPGRARPDADLRRAARRPAARGHDDGRLLRRPIWAACRPVARSTSRSSTRRPRASPPTTSRSRPPIRPEPSSATTRRPCRTSSTTARPSTACRPAASAFPVGTTPVTCIATDASDNAADSTFAVTVDYVPVHVAGASWLEPVGNGGTFVGQPRPDRAGQGRPRRGRRDPHQRRCPPGRHAVRRRGGGHGPADVGRRPLERQPSTPGRWPAGATP